MALHGLLPNERVRQTTVGLKAFFSIAAEWDLNEQELIGLLVIEDGPSLRRKRERPPIRLARKSVNRCATDCEES